MKKINRNQFKHIMEGANLLGTGGGGTTNNANLLLQKIRKPVLITPLSKLNKTDLICCVFGVGGKQNSNPSIAIKNAITLFSKINKKKISAIIPVETGPMAFATTFYASNLLNIPVLDADIVGLRSSPEVYLETITLANLNRTPCAISDDKNNQAILWKTENINSMENFFRNFAISSGGDAFIAGYPLLKKQLENVIYENSITISENIGLVLLLLKNKKISFKTFCTKTGWKCIDIGTIYKQDINNSQGFASGKYFINAGKNEYEIVIKNENIVCIKNNTVIVTVPDSISLLDIHLSTGINNFNSNINKQVAILAKKSIPIWRTQKGKKLFSPKQLGLTYKQKLLT